MIHLIIACIHRCGQGAHISKEISEILSSLEITSSLSHLANLNSGQLCLRMDLSSPHWLIQSKCNMIKAYISLKCDINGLNP